jgi:hemoglobin
MTPQDEDRRPLYERIGGAEGLGRLVDAFYSAILADPELAPFFAHVSMDKLRRMQHEFLAAALGGPEKYSGTALSQAHSGLGITTRHFNRFMQHVIEAMQQLGVRPRDVQDVISRINTHVDEIVGYGPSAG